MKSSTPNPEFDAFANLIDHLLMVPHSELKRRMEEYKKAADRNPHKRGPKRKIKTPSASPDSTAQQG